MAKWITKKQKEDLNRQRQMSIIREAKALRVVGKHSGSKPIKRLLQNIARAHWANKSVVETE